MNKKIAIIHDDFTTWGGGEHLVLLLARELQADIITFSVARHVLKLLPQDVTIRALHQELNPDTYPAVGIMLRRYYFSKLDVSREYVFFIFSGVDAVCAAKRHQPNILYNHSVPREWYDEHIREFNRLNKLFYLYNNSWFERFIKKIYLANNRLTRWQLPGEITNIIVFLRILLARPSQFRDVKYFTYGFTKRSHLKNIAHIKKLVANSTHTQNMVQYSYNRESEVIYPPVEIRKYYYQKPQRYWLSINRITPYKRIELQFAVFSKLPQEKLYIIGDCQEPGHREYYRKLQYTKPPNVEFLGILQEGELLEKLSGCTGLIYTAINEDFGMAPVEAMAAGKPVVCVNEGGCKETVIDGTTGRMASANVDDLADAVKEIARHSEKYRYACMKRAEQFDLELFVKKIRKAML